MSFRQALRWTRVTCVVAAMLVAPFSLYGNGPWNIAMADEIPTSGDGGCNNAPEGMCSFTNENGNPSWRLGAYCSWYRPDCDTCCPKQNSTCEGQNGFTSDWGQCG